jgi:hypothetical protein
MHLTKYAVLLGLLIIIVTVAQFGAHFGYTVNGVPQAGAVPGESSWYDGIVFMFTMVTFGIDGVPGFLSAIFLIMNIMVLYLIISLIRGTD